MQQDDARHPNKPADCTNVVDEIEIELIEYRSVDGVRGANQQQRVAVGRRIHHGLGPDIAPAARPVVDDEGLAEPFRQPLGNQPRDDIVSAARGKADDDAHRPRWICLRPNDIRHGRDRSCARCQMQKFSAGKFHHLYARGQRVARERAEMIDEGRCPPTAWALPLEKGLWHVPVGSSAIKLPQARGDAKGRNVAFWHEPADPECPLSGR